MGGGFGEGGEGGRGKGLMEWGEIEIGDGGISRNGIGGGGFFYECCVDGFGLIEYRKRGRWRRSFDSRASFSFLEVMG